MSARRSFIASLGPEANLGVGAAHLIPLELARRGLARCGLAGLVAGAVEVPR